MECFETSLHIPTSKIDSTLIVNPHLGICINIKIFETNSAESQ